MITAKYYLHGILLPSGQWITDLTDTTPATNTELITEYAAGQPMPSFRGAHGAKPDISFSTTQCKTVLDACGMIGANYSGSNVDLYYRAAVNRATRGAIGDSLHLRIRLIQSMFYWTRIAATQTQLATIDCRIVPCWDGTNPPLTGLGSQTIPAQQVASLPYVLGPVYFAGVQAPGINSWQLDLGPTLDEEPSDGEDFLSWVGIERHDPVLTCTPRDQVYWNSLGLDGGTLTTAAFYLRHRQADSTRVSADGNAEHIKFAGTDNPCGLLTIENTSDGHPKAAQMNLRAGFRNSDAGSAHPLSVATASAIT